MLVAPLSDRNRRRLIGLLAEDQVDGERLTKRLKELRALEGMPTFSTAVHLLAHLDLPEETAETLLGELLQHRREMSNQLGRDPGLRVAAIDFLSNVKRLLENPTIVEFEELETTERSAVTDPLTELYNRRYFQSSLEIEVQRTRRYSLALSLLLLDLDLFKAVNDLYGHPFGDLVLKRTGQIIRQVVRESDVACRFGGEEFAVVLPETERLGAFAVAERVRSRLANCFGHTPIEGRLVAMTISGGVASYPEDGEDPAVLISWADRALYRSKTTGRNRITAYHAERRGSMRFPALRLTMATISVVGRDGSEHARPINLSRGGALVVTEEVCSTADHVELILEQSGESSAVAGRVVRVEDHAAVPGSRRVAIAFEEAIPETVLMRHIIRGKNSARPERGRA